MQMQGVFTIADESTCTRVLVGVSCQQHDDKDSIVIVKCKRRSRQPDL